MGFLKRLFARQHGGTRVGNLLRQAAYNNTAGLLGSNMGGYAAAATGDRSFNGINENLEQ